MEIASNMRQDKSTPTPTYAARFDGITGIQPIRDKIKRTVAAPYGIVLLDNSIPSSIHFLEADSLCLLSLFAIEYTQK